MAETTPQDYRHHRRYDPWYHFFGLPILIVAFFVQLWHAIKEPSGWSIWQAIVAAALRVQDRIIRLEERLRLATLLTGPLRDRVAALTPDQLIGIRFASDAEVAGLVQAALDEGLTGEAIKKRIQTWRADFLRV